MAELVRELERLRGRVGELEGEQELLDRDRARLESRIAVLREDRERVEMEWRRMRDQRDAQREINEELLRFAMDGARDALQNAMGFLQFKPRPPRHLNGSPRGDGCACEDGDHR